MKRTGTRYIPFAAGLLCILMADCADDDARPDAPGTEPEGQIAITLRIPMDGGMTPTRAYPTGGGDGDGREAGLERENAVADANIFFFKGSGFNPASTDPGSVEVTGVYVADLAAFTDDTEADPFEKKITVKVKTSETNLEEKGLLTAPEVGFITVLNAGEDLSATISDLKSLREYASFASAWTEGADGCGNFLMTTAYDAMENGNVSVGGSLRHVGSNRLEKNTGTGNDPNVKWTGETTVQRLCARVDLMYTDANAGDGELVYVTDYGNKVHVTNVLPVNFMQKPSYLLTKATAALPAAWTEAGLGQVTWGGVELTSEGSDRPANYVLDPFTLAKAAGAKDLTAWYGSTAAASVRTALADGANGPISGYASRAIDATSNKGYSKTSIIGYANENVLAPTCHTAELITGLALRATFQPRMVWSRTDDGFEGHELSDDEWAAMADKTVWRWQPSAGVEGVREQDAMYFTSQADVDAYAASHPQALATVSKYENGVCYYNLWLRHYNDETYKTSGSVLKETYPMEFAIVRNNIYRVGMAFTGPGDPEPTLREPDTMMSRIFVRKWNRRAEQNPLQF